MDGRAADLLPVDWLIAELCTAQFGVISRGQLTDLGLARGAIEHRLRHGRLHRVHRGVYAVGHPILPVQGRWMAALLAHGPQAVLSHRSAGALWGIRPAASGAVDLTIPSQGGRYRRRHVTVYRSEALGPRDISRRDELPVTSPARTLADLASILPAASLRRAIERAEELRLFDLHALRAVIAAHPTRRGTGALRRILDEFASEPAMTRSDLEACFLELCAAHGIPRPLVNARVGPSEVDFLWPRERLIVETDGHADHGTRTAFEEDRRRDVRLRVMGFQVTRFTYRQVAYDPAFVGGAVLALLERAARVRAHADGG